MRKFLSAMFAALMVFSFGAAGCNGVKGIEYFCYMSPAIGVEFSAADVAMIDRNNQKTPIYDYVKNANAEILAFDHVFLQYDWENTMPLYGTAEEKKNTAFQGLKAPLSEISVRFNADKVLVYENGAAKTVSLENGVYNCTLTSGEGRFVIPYREA